MLRLLIYEIIANYTSGTDMVSDHRLTAQRLKMRESRIAELEGKLKQSVQVLVDVILFAIFFQVNANWVIFQLVLRSVNILLQMMFREI